VDTAGLPKSRFYQYKSQWSDKKVLFVMPHWNFEGREGEKVPVHIFTNYERVELFVNGQSMGVKEKSREVRDYGINRIIEGNPDIARCRIVYEDVVYAPGELVAVAIGENGEELARTRVKTAGEPYTVKLVPETKTVTADGEDACFVRAYVVDRYGYVCPTASNLIRFRAEGAGVLYATDNGDPRETAGYFRTEKKALNGALVAVIRSVKGQTGRIDLYADSEGLVSCATTVFAK
jgi:beta-galactosidase